MDKFYQDHHFLINCAIVGAFIVSIAEVYVRIKRKKQDLKLTEESDLTFPPPPAPVLSEDEDSEEFRNQALAMITEMVRTTSLAEVTALYWEIERLEDDYRGRVPDGILKLYVNWLYHVQAQEQDRISVLSAPKATPAF
jgi:hypothetical protein